MITFDLRNDAPDIEGSEIELLLLAGPIGQVEGFQTLNPTLRNARQMLWPVFSQMARR